MVTGRVVRLTDFGAFIELQEGNRRSDSTSPKSPTNGSINPPTSSRDDQSVMAKIIKMDIAEQKIGLSIRRRPRSSIVRTSAPT